MNVVHIHDVVLGHLAALEYGRRGERYILGGENIPHQAFISDVMEIAGVHAQPINLPHSLVTLMRTLSRGTRMLVHMGINPGILHLAGYYFYYNLEKSIRELRLPPPCSARQAVQEAYLWFKEHPIA